MALIELRKLEKSYGKVKALRGLDLKVPRGSLFGLLGPNGAGKTTALRILCTLLSPDAGEVFVAGFNAETHPRFIRRELGYVAQEVALDKILTGRELLNLQADLYHLTSLHKNKRIIDLIDRLEMENWIDRRCGTYSGGMRRRLDLAAGLLHKPQILIMDEPTVGLDIESRKSIWCLLKELKNEGTTILLSSHYLEEVEALSDCIAIIDNGKVIAEGAPEDLKRKLGGDRVTLRVREFSDENESQRVKQLLVLIKGITDVVVNKAQGFSLNLVIENEDILTQLRLTLEEADFSVFSIAQSRPSLDDVYLSATGRTLMDAELEVAGQRDSKSESKKAMR